MRLSEKQIEIIKNSLKKYFGHDFAVYLFGSRVDDSKKGGDIDILVELNKISPDLFEKKIRVLSDIKSKIGEQKIDLIITADRINDSRSIVSEAYRTGVIL